MSHRRLLLAAAALAAFVSASAAQAASALLFSNNGVSRNAFGAGLATVQYGDSGKFGTASGYEFLAGIGVSAFAHSSGGAAHGYQNMQVRASAAMADSFRVGTSTPGLFDAGSGVFVLTYAIEASGSARAIGNDVDDNVNNTPGLHSSATADYSYGWNVGGQTGGGSVDRRFFENGGTSTETTGFGEGGTAGALLFVRLNDVVGLSFFATAGATADGSAGATGIADFGHTLRWGGITDIGFIADGTSNTIALPDDFELTLVSDTSGFDYRNAAGPNPFTSGVPEPAAWALLIAGFGLSGAVLRRRRLVPRNLSFESRN